jgi:hypothetical protein
MNMRPNFSENFSWKILKKDIDKDIVEKRGDTFPEPEQSMSNEAMRIEWESEKYKYTIDKIRAIKEEIRPWETSQNISDNPLRLEHLKQELIDEKNKLPAGMLDQFEQYFPEHPEVN